jgi:hypothetical protein
MITLNEFSKQIAHPVSVPQAMLQPSDVMTVSTIKLSRGQEANMQWLGLTVLNTSPLRRTSGMVSATQIQVSPQTGSSYTVSTSGDFFIASDVGGVIDWVEINGTMSSVGYSIIDSVPDSRTAIVTASESVVSSKFFILTQRVPLKTTTGLKNVYVGCYVDGYDEVQLPMGIPSCLVESDGIGSVILNPYIGSRFIGPTTISVVLVNNTENFTYDVTVTGNLKVTTHA